MTIKVPLPRTQSRFAFRRGRMSAFYAGPGFVLSGRGYNLGAFYMGAPRPPLPARTVFRGMGAFYTKAATPPLPAPSVFRGMGRVRRLRGLGDANLFGSSAFTPPDNTGPNYFDTVLNKTAPINFGGGYMTPIDLTGDAGAAILPPVTLTDPLAGNNPGDFASLTPPAGVAVDANGNPLPVGGYPTSTTPYNPASTNPALDAFNAALANSPAASQLTSTQLAALSAAAGKATPAQLQQAAAQLNATPATAGLSIGDSLINWFGASTTLGGYSVKNSTLVVGGAATVIGLSLLSQMSGGKKRRR